MDMVDIAEFVEHLATESAKCIMPLFRTDLISDDKSPSGTFDPVTKADREAEACMRSAIRQKFPTHGIIGEEFGPESADAEFVWILDPIDGTKSFISGLPLWGTLIGLRHKDRVIYGMMHQPFTQERFYGDGIQSFWRGNTHAGNTVRKLRTRECMHLNQATVMTTSPSLLRGDDLRKYQNVEKHARLHRYGGDCYAYCMLAAGHIDLVIESGLNAYDIAALIPIIEGAGGIVTTWDGRYPSDGGAIIAAGDRRVYSEAVRLLAE